MTAATSNKKDSDKLRVTSNELKNNNSKDPSLVTCHLSPVTQKGFTLIEVILSVTITAIIVLIIGAAMRLSFRSVDMGEKRMELTERIRASLNILDSQIQSEIPLTYEDKGVRRYYFRGENDFMQFATNYSIWSGQKSYVNVSYKVESDSGGRRELYATESIVGTSMEKKTKVLTNLDSISFEYFYKDPFEEKGRWVERWTDEVSMPENIRLNIGYGAKKLSLIIPMRARGTLKETL